MENIYLINAFFDGEINGKQSTFPVYIGVTGKKELHVEESEDGSLTENELLGIQQAKQINYSCSSKNFNLDNVFVQKIETDDYGKHEDVLFCYSLAELKNVNL